MALQRDSASSTLQAAYPTRLDLPEMYPLLFGKAPKKLSDLVELVVIACPVDVLLESKLLFDGHRAIPSCENQWSRRFPSPIWQLPHSFQHPVKLRPFKRHWDQALLRSAIGPQGFNCLFLFAHHTTLVNPFNYLVVALNARSPRRFDLANSSNSCQ